MRSLIVLPLIVFCGCSLVQSSSRISLPGGVAFTLPKDAKFDYLSAEVPIVYTNGAIATATIVISNGVFKMNPAVLDAATARDAALIQATANAASQLMGQAAAIATKGVKP